MPILYNTNISHYMFTINEYYCHQKHMYIKLLRLGFVTFWSFTNYLTTVFTLEVGWVGGQVGWDGGYEVEGVVFERLDVVDCDFG